MYYQTAMTEQTEISTSRLLLKSITPSIIHHLFNTLDKEAIIQYFGFDNEGYEYHREMHEQGMETHRISLFFFLLIEKQSNRPIGDCGFHTWNRAHRRAELFYNLRKDSDKRKGYMTEALKEVIDYGFGKLNLHRIQAMVDNSNTPSVRLLNRFGFTKEGTMREDYVVDGKNEDSDCYSLLLHEWDHD